MRTAVTQLLLQRVDSYEEYDEIISRCISKLIEEIEEWNVKYNL